MFVYGNEVGIGRKSRRGNLVTWILFYLLVRDGREKS